MNARLTLSVLAAIALGAAPPATAAATRATESVSSNWAGYVVKRGGADTHFSKVSGSWVQPAVKAGTRDSYSVFWLGLGGSGGASNALEQVGTEANYVHGQFEYYAWYELVPDGPVKLSLTIHPGDRIYAEVSVIGSAVTVAIADQTSDQWAKKTLHMNAPDTSTAEWIAEAPSSCDHTGSCRPLTLADFGTVDFTDAAATADGHTGPIDDPNWTMEAVWLTGSDGFVSLQMPGAGAEPSTVSSDGSSFSVSWSGGATQTSASGGPTLAGADGSPGSPQGY